MLRFTEVILPVSPKLIFPLSGTHVISVGTINYDAIDVRIYNAWKVLPSETAVFEFFTTLFELRMKFHVVVQPFFTWWAIT